MIVLGNPENRRVQLFLEACREAGVAQIEVLSWVDYLREPDRLDSAGAGVLRIESPGENAAVECALLKLGRDLAEAEGEWEWLPDDLNEGDYERGRIYPSRQWYLGWELVLRRIRQRLGPGLRPMNAPGEIAVMFDKANCHDVFRSAKVPTPQLLGIPASFEAVVDLMEQAGCRRVFVKPAHASSASGVVALQISRHGVRAQTPVEVVFKGGTIALYNSKRIRSMTSLVEVRTLVDAVARHRCVLEAWYPKAGFQGLSFDLRILVIAGRAQHVVVRQSRSPMTNLHLGSKRGDVEALRAAIGQEGWREILLTAERAARCFPQSHYAGVDVLVAPGFARSAVAEINAFGDLLPRLWHEGRSTYGAELAALG